MPTWHCITEILPDVWRVEEGAFVAWYLLRGRDRAVLVDTGWGVTDPWVLARELAGGRDLLAVNTHVHPDHANGNGRCRVTAMGVVEWETHGRKWRADAAKIRAGQWLPSQHLLSWAKHLLPVDFDAAAYDASCGEGLPIPDRLLADGEAVDLGDISLVTHLCPGHTSGHCVFAVPERGLLFGGDMLLQGQLWLHLRCSAPPEESFTSFERLRSLAPSTRHLLTSHGPTDLPGDFIAVLCDDLERVRAGMIDPEWKKTFAGDGWYYDFGGYGAIFTERV